MGRNAAHLSRTLVNTTLQIHSLRGPGLRGGRAFRKGRPSLGFAVITTVAAGAVVTVPAANLEKQSCRPVDRRRPP